jgi:hypothetical protein
MIRTGRAGKDCAQPMPEMAGSMLAPNASLKNIRRERFIFPSPIIRLPKRVGERSAARHIATNKGFRLQAHNAIVR